MLAATGANLVPLYRRIFSDQLTPVQAYRCMVEHGDLESPSFLLESVVNGDQQGRYSFVGAMPALEVVAKGHKVGRQGGSWEQWAAQEVRVVGDVTIQRLVPMHVALNTGQHAVLIRSCS